jgi:hypothetical protein
VTHADRQAITDDYQELLGRGYVVRRYSNALGWMSALSAEARADCLRVQTSISPLNRNLVWALLRRTTTDDRMAETARVMLLHELAIETASDQDAELDATLD